MDHATLNELLKDNIKAKDYFDSLHPIVQFKLRGQANKIATIEDLYAFSNNAMTESLREFNGIYQDGDKYPDGME
ncbi:MAG: hypothetical protein ACOX8Q_02545 [Christensenellales bacterium]|jgi:hypothetical protein